MKTRRFGKTELNIPMISCGGMRFQTSWKREDTATTESIANVEKIVIHALELGINHFETAHGYGTSEYELSHVLPHLDRKRFILQTKCPPKPSLKEFIEVFETSMHTLKADRLDLFALHGLNNTQLLEMSQSTGIVDHLFKLKEQGIIGHLGFSTHASPDCILQILESQLFDYVNLWYSYVYPYNWPAILKARELDMGVFIISPNDKGGQLYAPPEKLTRLCAPLDPMTFNDAFILAHPEIHTISCGASRPSDFDLHIQAVDQIDELQPEVTRIKAGLDHELDQLYGPDWAQHYTEGLSRWEDTPGQINIIAILWLWNLLKAFDLEDYAQFRYNLLGNAEHWFGGQNAGKLNEIDTEVIQQALSQSPYRERILTILPQAHELLFKKKGKRLSEGE